MSELKRQNRIIDLFLFFCTIRNSVYRFTYKYLKTLNTNAEVNPIDNFCVNNFNELFV